MPETVVKVCIQDQILRVLATLTPREEKVLRMRFGIGEETGQAHEVGCQCFETTLEKIRKIEQNSIRKLATPKTSKRRAGK